LTLSAWHCPEAFEIEPGAETTPGSGDDDGPAVMVGVHGVKGLVQLLDQLIGEGVQGFRSVEGQLGDVRFWVTDQDVGHRMIVGPSGIAGLDTRLGGLVRCVAPPKQGSL
jgi:hypothetical protein